MTVPELIKILEGNEYGGITKRPRQIHLTINGKITLFDFDAKITGSGDGIVTDIDIDICGEETMIKPENNWIQVSERLPKKEESVLLSTNGGFVEEGFYAETNEFHVVWRGFETRSIYWDEEVIAWQPLPEPYHTESEDK